MHKAFTRRQVGLLAGAGLLTLTAPARAQSQFINVLTGGTSGVYYPLGVALSPGDSRHTRIAYAVGLGIPPVVPPAR